MRRLVRKCFAAVLAQYSSERHAASVVIVVVIMIMFMAAIMVVLMSAVVFVPRSVFGVTVPFNMMPLIMKVPVRGVHVVVPAIRHEIHRPAARVVFVTVLRPMLLVAGRYMQIERLRWRAPHDHACWHRYYRPRHEQLRMRQVPQIDLTVHTWCGDVYGNADVASRGDGRDTQ
jgi:hypothetical protein